MNSIGKDFGFLLRQFARRPLLYALIIFILALGVGANTAMFTLSDAVLYRDLAVRDGESLVHDTTSGKVQPEFTKRRTS